MSKTFRKRGNIVPKWVTHDYDISWPSRARTPWFEKPDAKKCLARWYSDSNYKTGTYNQHNWRVHRNEAKQELIKFIKDAEHEVQIRRKRYFMWD